MIAALLPTALLAWYLSDPARNQPIVIRLEHFVITSNVSVVAALVAFLVARAAATPAGPHDRRRRGTRPIRRRRARVAERVRRDRGLGPHIGRSRGGVPALGIRLRCTERRRHRRRRLGAVRHRRGGHRPVRLL